VSPADNGHYECRPSATTTGLVDVVWIAPQSPPRLLATLALGRLELLATATSAYVAEHRDPYPGHPASAVLLHTDPAEVATLDDLRAAKRRRLIEEW